MVKTDVFGPYTKDDARLIQQFYGNKGAGMINVFQTVQRKI